MNCPSISTAWFDPISIIGVILQIVTIIVGIFIIKRQVNLNHISDLKIQKENFKKEIHLKIFNKISERIESATHLIMSSSTKIQGIPFSIKEFWRIRNHEKINVDPSIVQASSINKAHYDAYDSILNILSILESHEIAFPSFRIFIDMIIHQIRIYNKAYSNFYFTVLLYLPTNVPEKKQEKLKTNVIKPIKPSPQKLKILEDLANKYLEESIVIQSYIIDLGVEMQNYLLGSIFETRIPRRKPKDPKKLVINTDPETILKLKKYLKDNNPLLNSTSDE